MTHETTLTRENGSKVRIIAEFSAHIFSDELFYSYVVDCMTPKQKEWQRVRPQGNSTGDALLEEWEAEELKYVTKQEIHQAKLELWKKLKPVEG